MNYNDIVRGYEELRCEVYRIADIISSEIKLIDPEAKIFEFAKCIDPQLDFTGAKFTNFFAEYNHVNRNTTFISWTALIPSEYFYLTPKEIRECVRRSCENNNYGWKITE